MRAHTIAEWTNLALPSNRIWVLTQELLTQELSELQIMAGIMPCHKPHASSDASMHLLQHDV